MLGSPLPQIFGKARTVRFRPPLQIGLDILAPIRAKLVPNFCNGYTSSRKI